jgi:RimJ/RimL family protein N-acetyltransferase
MASVWRIADQLADADADAERTGLGMLAIELASSAGFMGYCGLTAGQAIEEEPEIALERFRSAQGSGYATEAARVVIGAARATGRTRLWATVREWNHASVAVLAKLDFVDSGRCTEDGERGDSVWMTRALGDD